MPLCWFEWNESVGTRILMVVIVHIRNPVFRERVILLRAQYVGWLLRFHKLETYSFRVTLSTLTFPFLFIDTYFFPNTFLFSRPSGTYVPFIFTQKKTSILLPIRTFSSRKTFLRRNSDPKIIPHRILNAGMIHFFHEIETFFFKKIPRIIVLQFFKI